MKFLVFAGLFWGSLCATAQVAHQGVIDYGFFQPTVVNGDVVPDSMSDLRDMTPRIYILDKSSKPAMERFCTGVLIAPDVVLTAAHCLYGDAKDLTIEVNFQQHEIPAQEFVIHPQYESLESEMIHGHPMSKGGYNDIALIFLSQSVFFATPALLPEQGYHIKNDTRLTLAGYGFLGPDKENEKDELYYIEIPVKEISKGRLRMEGKKTSCEGDSGGPLLLKRGQRWMSIGVVSIGDCVEIATPMRTSHYSDWIQETIQEFRSKLAI